MGAVGALGLKILDEDLRISVVLGWAGLGWVGNVERTRGLVRIQVHCAVRVAKDTHHRLSVNSPSVHPLRSKGEGGVQHLHGK